MRALSPRADWADQVFLAILQLELPAASYQLADLRYRLGSVGS